MPVNAPAIGPGLLFAILLVVIGVPLAGFYLFQASSAEEKTVEGDPTIVADPHDEDGNGQAGWIRLVLLEDPDRTYTPSTLHVELVDEEGTTLVEHDDPLPYVRDAIVCLEPEAEGGLREADRACRRTAKDASPVAWFQAEEAWAPGDTLYVPCQDASDDGSGPHRVRVSIHSEPVIDQRVVCQEQAPGPLPADAPDPKGSLGDRGSEIVGS